MPSYRLLVTAPGASRALAGGCKVTKAGRRVLRSETAELVRQELYGWVLAQYAVRWLLHQGAACHPEPHATRPFTKHLHLMRRSQPQSGAFPPRTPETPSALV